MSDQICKEEKEWKQQLTPEQFQVTRRKGTERAFSNPLHTNKQDGIYLCVCCRAELFDSDSKFDSGTGWPSFFQPCRDENVTESEDRSLFMVRREVLCSRCGAHLGHVFEDGPEPTGLRYCLNGAALEFRKREQ